MPGHDEAAELLQQTLEEERAADEKLSAIAEGGVNQEAASAGRCDAEEYSGEPSSRKGMERNAVARPAPVKSSASHSQKRTRTRRTH